MLTLALLGPPEVRHVGRLLTFPTRKTLALVVYLAVQGGRQPREKLTALLWPESDEDRGRAALRQTLALLGDTLRAEACVSGQHLVVRRDALAFDFGSEFTLDVAALQSSLTPRLERAPDEIVAVLTPIAEHYKGDFLEGFSLTDAPEFDAWASVQREVFHRRMDAVFDRLSLAQLQTRRFDAALDTTARWVAHDRWSEPAHRRLIQLYAAAGERTAALRAYETCRLILSDELGVEPDSDTQALAERIRSSEPTPARQVLASSGSLPTLPMSEAPLVGRIDEHHTLGALFQAVAQGETRAVVIRGEAGIGKTRLALDFMRWASAQGADVLEGRAFETSDRLPYLPVVEAFRARLRMEPDLHEVLGPIWLTELARVLPEVRDRCPGLPQPPAGPESEARARLFEAFSLLGQTFADRAPTVLLIDDVQWTDVASLDLLGYMLRGWQRDHTRVLLVLALRGEDVPSAPVLGDWLSSLGRVVVTTSLTLGPLSAEDTRDLVTALCGSGVEREIGAWLYGETRGQPFYLVETLKSLAERGLLAHECDDRLVDAVRGFVSPSVRELIRSRLDRLSGRARQTLTAAAVLGPRFGFDQLRHVADLDERESLSAFDELIARHFIQQADEPDQFTFAHDKVRGVVYDEAGEPRRRLMHSRAMEALAAEAAPPSTLARHAQAAGQPLQAFEYYLAGGDAAVRLFAGRDAIAQYEHARELLATGGLGADEHLRTRQLYERLGHAYELVGDFGGARVRYEEMLALARDHAEPEIEITALNRLAALSIQGALNLADASSLLGSAQERVQASGDRVGLTDTELNLAELHVYRWDLDNAIGHAQRALLLARDLGLQDHIARSLNLLALAENTHGKVEEAEHHAEEGRSLAAQLGNRALEAECLSLLAEARIRLGRAVAGIADARAARLLSLRIGNPYLECRSAHKLAIGLMDAGDYEASMEAAREGLAAAHASGARAFQILNLVALGNVQRGLWLQDAARVSHEEALGINDALELPIYSELISSVLCADLAVAGDWRSAVAHARRALALREHAYLYTGLYRWYETEALVRAGQIDEAAEDLRRMDERIGANRRYRLPYLRALSVLDRWRGDLPRAIRRLEAAAALASEICIPAQEWQVRAYLADLYRLVGDEDRARTAAARAGTLQRAVADRISTPEWRARFVAAPPPLRSLELVTSRVASA